MILVLWILMIISFLSSGYVAHNRNKAGLAIHAQRALAREGAALSVLKLMAAGQYEFLRQKSEEFKDKKMVWTKLSPGGVDLYVLLEAESSRMNVNSADEAALREKVRSLYGEAYESEADVLTDALLDWRDSDNDVRLHGAEKGYYEFLDQGYIPGNSKFKCMTELTLVKGMTSDIFWGTTPLDDLHKSVEDLLDLELESDSASYGTDDHKILKSFLETFTIYANSDTRVSIVFPGLDNALYYEIYFIETQKSSVKVKIAEHLSRVVMVETKKDKK